MVVLVWADPLEEALVEAEVEEEVDRLVVSLSRRLQVMAIEPGSG